SKELTEKINSFYNWEYNENFSNENLDSIFIGTIDTTKIKTDSQKISFLIGAFTRFGKKNDAVYSINGTSSVENFKIYGRFLKDLRCNEIREVIIEAVGPTLTVYFQPSDRLKKYLTYYIPNPRDY
ncbi:MAG: hypothetical protein CFE23_16575, partial [Flavobacterium sp. BFFFF1]|uniref:hypothetical protein n=1 Tax=Flavobacterium sp. BFFFF1 TaxID=2015557 RepID=UPI000BD58A8F